MIIEESLNIPCEGIFWLIDGEIISFTDQVNPRDAFETTDLLHKEVWKAIEEEYKYNGRVVPYDFYPRGRVKTLVIQDHDGNLDHYESYLYMDKCISKKHIDIIVEDFRLYLPNVNLTYSGQLFVDGSHYTCYNCRK